MKTLATLRLARKPISRPSLFHPKPDSTALLLRWLMRNARLSETHAGIVAELAFSQGRPRTGLTSAEFPPSVRVSDSIHKLRHRHGLGIQTERVGHGGIYGGEHAIYRLSSPVRVVELVRAAEMRSRKTSGMRARKHGEGRHVAA